MRSASDAVPRVGPRQRTTPESARRRDGAEDGHQLLAIYLHDHRAGAAAGTALVRRMVTRYGSDPDFEALHELARAIEADRDRLDELRRGLAIEGGQVKRLGAVVAERLGRLKLNGRIVRSSPLSPLLEIEALYAGVVAKQRLWVALRAAADTPLVAGFDLDELVQRADAQLDTLVGLHRRAATRALDLRDQP